MFTVKATAYLVLAVSMLAVALLLNDFTIGVLVLGIASLFFLSNLRGLPEKVNLELTRQVVPAETFGGETIRVESRVVNKTRSSLVNVEIDEEVDQRFRLEKGSNQTFSSIRPGGESRVTFEFRCPPRSNYQVGPLTVRARDPLGFYLTEFRLDSDALCVMPKPERMIGVQLRPRHVAPWPGVVPSRTLGIGTDYYSTRGYVAGDDPKRINWKASARYNSLIVNETEAERVTDVMVVVDTNVTFFGPVETEIFEREVHAAASIASLLLRQGNRVGLILQGGERASVPAGFGKRHERRILRLLAAAKPGRPAVSTSYVMNLLAKRIVPSRSQVIIVSPLLDPDLREGVKQLTGAGYSMLIVSPTPSLPEAFEDPLDQTALKILMLERSITLLALERSASVVDWPRNVPLSLVMTKVRRIRPVITA